MRSYPARFWYVVRKSCGVGWEVAGRSERGAQLLEEGVRCQLDVVPERLVPEAHVERDEPHVREAGRGVRVVGRRVEHDRGVLRG